MSYLTFNSIQSRTMTFSKSLNESFGRSSSNSKNIFLSYRREDKDKVDGIVRFLHSIGSSVYIDYLDKTLEEQTNEEVATTLRNRINSCSKFITLATPNSGQSKWMPWELGLGDRIVNYRNVAILPLTNSAYSWNDQEYGKLYAHVERDDNVLSGLEANKWFLIYPDKTKKNFFNWLNS